MKEFKFKLEHLKTHKENAHKLRSEVEQGSQQERKLEGEIEELEAQLIGFQEVSVLTCRTGCAPSFLFAHDTRVLTVHW